MVVLHQVYCKNITGNIYLLLQAGTKGPAIYYIYGKQKLQNKMKR